MTTGSRAAREPTSCGAREATTSSAAATAPTSVAADRASTSSAAADAAAAGHRAVTTMLWDAVRPAVSVATAASVYRTFAFLGTAQEHAYGAVASVHRTAPLTENTTEATAISSDATAVIVIVFPFVTFVLFAGEVIATVGG
jgi:hypothetical protein